MSTDDTELNFHTDDYGWHGELLNHHTDVHGMSRRNFENYGTCSVSLEYPWTSVIIRVKNIRRFIRDILCEGKMLV